jgi:hypothetical protein
MKETTLTWDEPNLSGPNDENIAVVHDALAMAIADAKRPENRISVAAQLRSPQIWCAKRKSCTGTPAQMTSGSSNVHPAASTSECRGPSFPGPYASRTRW